MRDRDGDRQEGVYPVVVGDQRSDEIGGEADDRADRQIDVAGQHDQRLADRDDRDDRDARSDAIEGAEAIVSVDERAEHHNRRDNEDEQAQFADLLRADVALSQFIDAVLERFRQALAHRRGHDGLLIGFSAIQNRHLPALAHDEHAVAEHEHLGQVRRDDDDANSLGRELADDRMHLGFGADVDAARRLVENQDRRVGVEPLAQHDLLLIAARKLGDFEIDRRRADRELRAEVAGGSPLETGSNEAEAIEVATQNRQA